MGCIFSSRGVRGMVLRPPPGPVGYKARRFQARLRHAICTRRAATPRMDKVPADTDAAPGARRRA